MKNPILHLLPAAALMVAACESPSDPPPRGPEGPLQVAVHAGDGQQDTVARTLPGTIRVRVADRWGTPIVGQAVTWTVTTQGGGTPSAASSVTDASGDATITWTLGTRAGAHELVASAGAGSNPDTVRATALPGPIVSASIVNHDTVHTLNPGQQLPVALAAVDQYGNAVAALTAQWTSRDPGIVSVAGSATGVLTAWAPGRVVIDVAAPTAALRVHVTVRGMAQTVVPLRQEVTSLHGAAGRMLASAQGSEWNTRSPYIHGRALWERTTAGWRVVPGFAAERAVRVLPSGEGWMMGWMGDGDYGVYRSASAGAAWTRVPAPALPNALTSVNGTVFIARYDGGVPATAFRREGGGWTPIPTPAAGADSAVGIGLLAATGAGDLVIGGFVSHDGGERPYLARWNGTATTRISLPAGISYGRHAQVSRLAARAVGPVYAAIIPDFDLSWRARLLVIQGTTATELANPLTQADKGIHGITVGPDGALYVAGEDMLARYADGAWQTWTTRDHWFLYGGLHVDEAGRIWSGALQNGGFDNPATLVFERIP